MDRARSNNVNRTTESTPPLNARVTRDPGAIKAESRVCKYSSSSLGASFFEFAIAHEPIETRFD